jgi:hypothetical protein
MDRFEQAVNKIVAEAKFMDPDDPRYKHFHNFYKQFGHPPPQYKRVHLGRPDNSLNPRGPMEKESLSLIVFERLKSSFEHWTNPEYSDSLKPEEMVAMLEEQFRAEMQSAWEAFEAWAKDRPGYFDDEED